MSTMKLYFINLYFQDNMGYVSRTARFEKEKKKKNYRHSNILMLLEATSKTMRLI